MSEAEIHMTDFFVDAVRLRPDQFITSLGAQDCLHGVALREKDGPIVAEISSEINTKCYLFICIITRFA